MSRLFSEELLQRKPYLAPLCLGLFSLLLFLPGLGARDLWAPGEPIYGEVIRVMHEKNEWLVPMLNGQIYADKPVLYFWLALAISKLAGGVNEWTLRLPTALGALGLVLVTYQFGKCFFSRQTGFLSGLALATSSRVLWESRFLRLDTVLSFFLFLGFYFWLKAFTKKGSAGNYLLGYLCFGLATLTKGPLGLVVPGFAVLSLMAFSGRWRDIVKIRLIAGSIVVAAVLVPWLGLLHMRGDDQWIHDFIWIHNVQNFALAPLGHVHPFYYYFINLPPDFLPWTLLVPGALIFYYPWKQRLQNVPVLALVCWFAATFVFFSASKSKIAYYLLPLLPSLALLVGSYLAALLSAENRSGNHWRWTMGILYGLAGILFIAGLSMPVAVHKLEQGLFAWSLVCAMVLVGGAICIFVFLRRNRFESFLLSILGLWLATSLVASLGILPYLDGYKSPRPIAEFVRSHVAADAPVYVFKSTMADFNYYARRKEIPVINSPDEVRKLASSEHPSYLIVNEKDLRQLNLGSNFQTVTKHRLGERKWYVIKLGRAAA